jgi:hypothetical protein
MATVERGLTLAQVEEMRVLWANGCGETLQQIAARYGCHYTTVMRRVKPVTLNPVTPIRRRPANMTTPRIEKRVMEAVRAGIPYRQISEELGPTPRTIKRILTRHGMKSERKPGPRPKLREVPVPQDTPTGKLTDALRGDAGLVPARPLAVAVEHEAEYRFGGRRGVCWEAQIDESVIRKWLKGDLLATHLEIADRVLIAVDRCWWEVYDKADPGSLHPRRALDVLAWLDVADRLSRLWDGEVLLGPDDPVLEAERVAALEWAA